MGLVARWFDGSIRARAAGFMVIGSGFAIIASGQFIPFVNRAVGPEGWRTSWVALGATVSVIACAALIFLRDGPRVICIVALLAAPVRAEGPHVAAMAGAGLAYGAGAGAHVELIASHVALYGGLGFDTRVWGMEAPGYSAGLRFFSGAGEGALLSLNFAYFSKRLIVAPAYPHPEHTDIEHVFLGGTLGWRQMLGRGFFLEGGLGAAWLRQRSASTADPPFGEGSCTGIFPRTCDYRTVVLDFDAGAGFSF